MTIQNPLLTQKQVIELTTLSRSTIRRKIDSGNFPKPITIGGNRIAWTKVSVEDWIATLN